MERTLIRETPIFLNAPCSIIDSQTFNQPDPASRLLYQRPLRDDESSGAI